MPPSESLQIQILSRLADEWIVCVKPAGLESEHELPAVLSQMLGGIPVFPVHRLDRDTAGLMVFALSSAAAAELSRLIQQGLLIKEYVARCHGALPAAEGRMEDLLFRDSRRNKVFVVSRPRAGVRRAALTWRRLADPGPDESLVRIRLQTGRTHQIRVQFASRGFPLYGDLKYGARDSNKVLFLFSCFLSFPWHGESCSFELFPPWAIPQ